MADTDEQQIYPVNKESGGVAQESETVIVLSWNDLIHIYCWVTSILLMILMVSNIIVYCYKKMLYEAYRPRLISVYSSDTEAEQIEVE